MINFTRKADDSYEKGIEELRVANSDMLEKRIPSRLNTIKLALVEFDKRQSYEPWRLALAVDLVKSIEYNCEQLLETVGKDRLPSVAWIARNLLELNVWVKYCGASRENAWRFHEDALRDVKGLTETHKKTLDAFSIEDHFSEIAAQRIKETANKLGLEDIDSDFLAVAAAAKAPGVDLGAMFGPFFRSLSKFAHPTAGLVHGISHQTGGCRNLQVAFTTEAVYFAAQSTLALEAQLEIPLSPE
jgi:hypothetical protein